MKEIFKAALRELLSKLRFEKEPISSIVDDDGDIDDDRYQSALEAQWHNEDNQIYERMDKVRELLRNDDWVDEEVWLKDSFNLLTKEGYKFTITKTF